MTRPARAGRSAPPRGPPPPCSVRPARSGSIASAKGSAAMRRPSIAQKASTVITQATSKLVSTPANAWLGNIAPPAAPSPSTALAANSVTAPARSLTASRATTVNRKQRRATPPAIPKEATYARLGTTARSAAIHRPPVHPAPTTHQQAAPHSLTVSTAQLGSTARTQVPPSSPAAATLAISVLQACGTSPIPWLTYVLPIITATEVARPSPVRRTANTSRTPARARASPALLASNAAPAGLQIVTRITKAIAIPPTSARAAPPGITRQTRTRLPARSVWRSPPGFPSQSRGARSRNQSAQLGNIAPRALLASTPALLASTARQAAPHL